MLEPEEIKQLIKSAKTFDDTKTVLEDGEKNFINNLFESSLLKLGNALEKVVSQSTGISDVTVEVINGGLLGETLNLDSYFIRDIMVNSHLTAILIDNDAVRKISSIITEEIEDGENLSEKEITTFCEVLDQMMNAFSKQLTKDTEYKNKVEINSENATKILEKGNMIQIAFSLKVSNVDTTVYYIISYELINELIGKLAGNKGEEHSEAAKENDLEEAIATVQPIKFEEFSDGIVGSEKENMELLMDLQLQVSVELGKVKKPIKEILQFTQGTIVELDRLAGENVDVLVSGKIIAKGEVVVVDQNFGVRITQIVIPEKRV
jgi:flagellar motor switch protein FliN/FliY